MFASFTYSVSFTRCFFNGRYISSSVSTFLDKYILRKRVTLESLLPVFLYTNYTRFIFEPPIFTSHDAFMYSKRYFTFYGTAILAYKRNTEMSHFDTSRAANRFYLSHNVKKIQLNIRRKVSHNSIRSVQISRVTQTRLFKRIRRIFRIRRRGYRFFRRRRRFMLRKRKKEYRQKEYKRILFPVSLRTSRVVRSSYFSGLYLKYSRDYKIPSKTRNCFRILPDYHDYNKLKIFGITRDYHVRSVNTPFINSCNFNSYYIGSSSFQEPHFLPGIQRFFFTGGRLCSSVSFLFSKYISKKVPNLSNNTQALLFRLEDELSVKRRGMSRNRLFRMYDRLAVRKAKSLLELKARERNSKHTTQYEQTTKYNKKDIQTINYIKHNRARRRYYMNRRRRRNRTRSRKWRRYRPIANRTYRFKRKRGTLSPSTVVLKLLRKLKKKKFRRYRRRR